MECDYLILVFLSVKMAGNIPRKPRSSVYNLVAKFFYLSYNFVL